MRERERDRPTDRRCWKSENTPGKVCPGKRLDQQWDGRWTWSSAADTFRDSVNRSGVDVLRTLYVRTVNLYVVRCWTGNSTSETSPVSAEMDDRLGM